MSFRQVFCEIFISFGRCFYRLYHIVLLLIRQDRPLRHRPSGVPPFGSILGNAAPSTSSGSVLTENATAPLHGGVGLLGKSCYRAINSRYFSIVGSTLSFAQSGISSAFKSPFSASISRTSLFCVARPKQENEPPASR